VLFFSSGNCDITIDRAAIDILVPYRRSSRCSNRSPALARILERGHTPPEQDVPNRCGWRYQATLGLKPRSTLDGTR
jgi:hypothetical protein